MGRFAQPIPETVRRSAEDAALQTQPGSNLRVLIGVMAAAVFMVVLAWSSADRSWALAWLGLMALVQAVRMHVESRISPDLARPLAQRMGVVVAAGALSGVVQAASVTLFLTADVIELSLQTLILLALSTGAVIYTAGHPKRYAAYMVPIIAALVWVWVQRGMPEGERTWLGWAMGALILFYGVNIWSYAKDTWAMYLNAAHLRHLEQKRNLQLQGAVSALESASRAKTRFIASASHDLRQPIHTIALLVGVLKLKLANGDSAQAVQLLDTVTISLARQLDDLLDISKLDAGVLAAEPKPLALAGFLTQKVAEFSSQAQAAQLELKLEVIQDAVVVTDAMLLERIVGNLLSNAIKFTPQGQILVRLTAEHETALLVVQDSGIGIAPQDQALVFDEFVQLGNPARDRSKGLGLGLSIVSRLCKLLQIDLRLISSPGSGTCIELRLPSISVPTKSPSAPADPAPLGRFSLRVLVLDDEPMILSSMSMLLHELGCEVIAVADIDSALERTASQAPDFFIADHRLGGTETGVDAVRRLRERYPDLPAILVSGDVAPDQLRAIEASGLRLLHKPMSMHSLHEALAWVDAQRHLV